ncbi:MAG TPA: TetR/AcrR family transcriptional regulator [Herpetosiphonaceae bacterium]
MESQDRRVKRTQRLLAEALIDLTLEKGYAGVTIREITERADVGYATFFRHYADKEALLADVLEVVLDELIRLIQTEQPAGDPAEVGTLLFRYVGEHSAVCQVLLDSRGAQNLVGRILAASTRQVLADNQPRPGSAVPPEIAAHHLVAAALALIEWWLANQQPYPPERMGQIYRDLIVLPTHALAFAAPRCA